jgi:hypothetical protein
LLAWACGARTADQHGDQPHAPGVHDRLAGSAIVQPVGPPTPAAACPSLPLFLLLPIVAIISLIFLGSQVSEILVESSSFLYP